MRNYLIIEKDTDTIEFIKNILKTFKDFNLIAISDDYDTAMNIILKEKPDLVFFNIDGLVENSFQFINEINLYSDYPPTFLTLSSSKEKAYDAFKSGFWGYLLKPLNELMLRKYILRYQKKKQIKSNNLICLKSYKDFQYLETDKILFLKADNNTTDFYMNDGTIISAFKTLKTYENLLPKEFLRIHKSYIINENYVSRIQYGKLRCSINKNNYNIPFTKTYLDIIEKMKNKLSRQSSFALN